VARRMSLFQAPDPIAHGYPQGGAGRRHAEHSLLLCCAAVCSEEWRRHRVDQLLSDPLDWDYLLDAAQAHGLTPLLHRALQGAGPSLIPSHATEALHINFRKSVAWNLLLAGELAALSELLKSEGVAFLAFKGPTLAMLSYGDLAFRPFNDLDILVPEADIPRAARLLRLRGYQPDLRLNKRQERAMRLWMYHYRFTQPAKKKLAVELHWRLMPPQVDFSIAFPMLEADAISVLVAGEPVPTLSIETLLPFLCVHGTKHLWWRSLGWVCDIARLIGLFKLDWEKMADTSRRLHCQSSFLLALSLAHHLLGAELPEPLTRQIAGRSNRRLTAEARKWLFAETSKKPSHLRIIRFQMAAQDRLQDRVRAFYYFGVSPAPADWKFLSQPLISRFYLPLRLLRIMGKTGLLWLKRLGRLAVRAR
jgi:hypothetical protein